MLGAAAVCAGLAVSTVDRYADEVTAQVGPLVPVVVARRDVERGTLVTPGLARAALARRLVPARFAPPSALGSVADAVGFRTLAAIAAGDFVGDAQLGAPRAERRDSVGARVGRLVEVSITGARTIAAALRPGALVDVLVTTEGAGPSARTYLALQRLQLVAFEPGAPGDTGADQVSERATATLRTTLRQAATLTAAQNFAREVRIVPRASGDTRRLGPVSVSAGALGD